MEIKYLDKHQNTLITEADNIKLAEVLDFIKTNMQKYGIAEIKQQNVIVASEEIFSNIAQYAYQEKGMVEISIALEGKTYTIAFKDNGKQYNPLLNPEADITLPPSQRKIGGLGILLVKRMTDMQEYTYENGYNVFKIGINLQMA